MMRRCREGRRRHRRQTPVTTFAPLLLMMLPVLRRHRSRVFSFNFSSFLNFHLLRVFCVDFY
jgi:hypothetical protein